jgi:hypothetical protein
LAGTISHVMVVPSQPGKPPGLDQRTSLPGLTWGWESNDAVPPGSTTLEITLTPDGAGTILRLRHIGLANETERRSHLGGWELYTGKLAAVFEKT